MFSTMKRLSNNSLLYFWFKVEKRVFFSDLLRNPATDTISLIGNPTFSQNFLGGMRRFLATSVRFCKASFTTVFQNVGRWIACGMWFYLNGCNAKAYQRIAFYSFFLVFYGKDVQKQTLENALQSQTQIQTYHYL